MGSVASDRASQFSLLYERCYPAVYAYAARGVAGGAASEIAAETFLIAWRRLDVVPAEPLPWLYGVARNVLLRHRATIARQGQVEAAVAHERVAPADGSPDSGDPRLWEAWEQLRDGDREVLALVAWEELSVARARLPGARVLGAAASRETPTRAAACVAVQHPGACAVGGQMTPSQSAELARLRAANPAPINADCVRGGAAEATLARILSEPAHDRPRGRRVRRYFESSSRRIGVALAVIAFGGGAAFAATDPPGWWSSNPTEARYGSNPAVHASAPTAQVIGCARSGAALHCASGSAGQTYTRIDRIRAPAARFTRNRVLAAIATARAQGRMTAAQAARFRGDVAAVPDSFFAEFELASRYATYSTGSPNGNGRTLAPPSGIPQFLACERVQAGLSCQNLNGDEHAPIGAGIYAARPAADWREVLIPPERVGQLPPGISFTRAEYRVLIDLLRFGTTTRTSSGGQLSKRPTATHGPGRG